MHSDRLPTASHARGAGVSSSLLALVGWLLIVAWSVWWIASGKQNHLFAGDFTRIPAWKQLGYDFKHNYLAAKYWASGGNPYTEPFGDDRGLYAYPPVVLPLFLWCVPLRKGVALVAWMGFISLAIGATAAMAVALRRRLNLTPLPWSFIAGCCLLSLPVLFAMERGQADALVVAAILIVALGGERASWRWDVSIGVCVGLGVWVKLYPAVLLPGLVVLGLWRAVALSAVMALIAGVAPWRWTVASIRSAGQSDRVGFLTEVREWLFDPNYSPAQLTWYPTISIDSHSLTTYWSTFWNHFGAWRLARVPGILGAALVLAPIVMWVSWRVFRSPARAVVALPYLLWLCAAATFGLPVSYDYNLIYLPLAAFAVWDRRDGVAGAALILSAFAWAQPFIFLPFPGRIDVLFFLKLASLVLVGACIVRRVTDASGGSPGAPESVNLPASRSAYDEERCLTDVP